MIRCSLCFSRFPFVSLALRRRALNLSFRRGAANFLSHRSRPRLCATPSALRRLAVARAFACRSVGLAWRLEGRRAHFLALRLRVHSCVGCFTFARRALALRSLRVSLRFESLAGSFCIHIPPFCAPPSVAFAPISFFCSFFFPIASPARSLRFVLCVRRRPACRRVLLLCHRFESYLCAGLFAALARPFTRGPP